MESTKHQYGSHQYQRVHLQRSIQMKHDITPIESLFLCGLKKSQIADKLRISLRSVQLEIQKLKETHQCDTDVQLVLKIFIARFDCFPTIKLDNGSIKTNKDKQL